MKFATCKKLAISLLLLLPLASEAHNGLLMIYGKVVSEMQSIGEVRVEVVSAKNDTLWDFISPRNGSYKVNVPLAKSIRSSSIKKVILRNQLE